MSFEMSALILAWVAIMILAFAMAGILRQVHILTAAVSGGRTLVGPPLGTAAPSLDGVDAWTRSTIAVFVEATCSNCASVLSEFVRLAQAREEGVDFMAIFAEDSNGLQSPHVRVLGGQVKAFHDFHIPVTPFGVAIVSGGTVVAASPIGSASALSEFVDDAQERMVAI